MTEPPHDFMDMESDLLASVEMADAVFAQLEAGARHGLDARQVSALLRCTMHLQDHAGEALRLWNVAIHSGQDQTAA